MSEKLEAAVRRLRELPSDDALILENEPMAKHTTFKIGGPVRAFVYARSFPGLARILSVAAECGVKPLPLGAGSNVLASDGAIERVVVCTRPDGSGYAPYMEALSGGVIRASAGASLPQLAMFALTNALTGLEWAAGIPGSLGGALRMNAGAYGGEISQVALKAETYSPEDGYRKARTLKASELDFGYRRSRFVESGEVVSLAELKLRPGEPSAIQAEMRRLAAERKKKQPLDLPSAGSVFKRPPDGYAAELIDKAGLKGRRVGGAAVSEKHAGFVVNEGGATCSDVLELIDVIRSEVGTKFGITLETELLQI